MAFDKGFWKPNPKQEIFLALPTTIKEAFYAGGAGSGKSDVLLVYALVRKWYQNSRFKQVFMRRTYPELKNEIIPRSRDIFLKFGATFNKSDMAWTFPREDQFGGTGLTNLGAIIFLGHCEHEDDVHKYDSMEINLYTPDELTSHTEFIYLYIGFTRVRTSDPTLPAIIRAAGMPGGVGHTFAKKRFVDPYKKGGKVIIGRGGIKRIYIHSTLADNPHIDPTYAQSLEALPEAEKKAKKYGDWDSYLGQVFDEFRDRLYPDEPTNAVHKIAPFDIPSWWLKIVTIDWGYAAMNYVTYTAISPMRRVYTYREQFWLKTKIAEWGPLVRAYIEKEDPKIIIVCKSASQDRGQEHTIQSDIELALGRSIELSSNSKGSRVDGKMLVHEYLRWKQKPQLPAQEIPPYSEEMAMWIYRNKGQISYENYLALYHPPEEEINLPKWQIFCCDEEQHEGHEFCCPTMIEGIKACTYDKPKNDKPAEDVAEFPGDDPYDNARYMLDRVERYFEEAAEEFEKIQKQEELLQKLLNSQDWTAFYRNMKVNEKTNIGPAPMVRYRRH